MEGKEYCEECKKEITKEMKESQQVIYASAEHTLDGEDFSFCDPMFGGIYCSQDCYEEQAGHKVAYKKGFQAGEIIKHKSDLQQELENKTYELSVILGFDHHCEGCFKLHELIMDRINFIKKELEEIGK